MLKNCGHSVKWKELAVNRTLLAMIKRRANTFFIDCSAESPIKLSSLVSHLFGLSARRMLKALADGETTPAALAALAGERLRATPEQLCDALGACTELNPVYRRRLKMALEELRLIDEQIGELDNQAIGAIAHRQCRLIWLILHQGVHYEERGPAVTKQSKQRRTARMIRQLRSLGYGIEPPNPQPSQAQAQ